MQFYRTKFRNSFILSTKKWIKSFPGQFEGKIWIYPLFSLQRAFTFGARRHARSPLCLTAGNAAAAAAAAASASAVPSVGGVEQEVSPRERPA